ncbi:MAG: rod shape-determining protein MreD [Bacteroidales bacterium]|nr:rod shape-determining protein MreD [Bacteroidales bacterium]
MKNPWFKYPFWFVALVLLQVLVLNNINLGGYIHPAIYVLFILLLPVRMNKNLVMLLAFLTGLTIDYFGNTLGLHAGASVMLAFARPTVLNLFFKPIDFGKKEEANLRKIGLGGFARYTFVLVFIHHSALFLFETLDFSGLHFTIIQILLSSVVTTLGILVVMMVFTSRK